MREKASKQATILQDEPRCLRIQTEPVVDTNGSGEMSEKEPKGTDSSGVSSVVVASLDDRGGSKQKQPKPKPQPQQMEKKELGPEEDSRWALAWTNMSKYNQAARGFLASASVSNDDDDDFCHQLAGFEQAAAGKQRAPLGPLIIMLAARYPPRLASVSWSGFDADVTAARPRHKHRELRAFGASLMAPNPFERDPRFLALGPSVLLFDFADSHELWRESAG